MMKSNPINEEALREATAAEMVRCNEAPRPISAKERLREIAKRHHHRADMIHKFCDGLPEKPSIEMESYLWQIVRMEDRER